MSDGLGTRLGLPGSSAFANQPSRKATAGRQATADKPIPVSVLAPRASDLAGGESRFQRWRFWFPETLGRRPRIQFEYAPLALNIQGWQQNLVRDA